MDMGPKLHLSQRTNYRKKKKLILQEKNTNQNIEEAKKVKRQGNDKIYDQIRNNIRKKSVL